MAKAKTRPKKSVSKFSSKKSFLFGRFKAINVIAIIVLFAAVGGVVLYKTHAAASALHEYHCGTAGIQHTPGTDQQNRYFTGEANALTCTNARPGDGYDYVVEAVKTSGINMVTGHYMWYGPYVDLNPGHLLHACWTYIPPAYNSASVVFDINYTNSTGQHILWQHNPDTIQPENPALVGDVWQEHKECADVTLGGKGVPAGPYTNLEIRVKVLSLGSGPLNSFKMYKTSWQLLN